MARARALYWAGHRWSRIALPRGPRHRLEWPYRIYNRLMAWSALAGEGAGPWSEEGPAMRDWLAVNGIDDRTEGRQTRV